MLSSSSLLLEFTCTREPVNGAKRHISIYARDEEIVVLKCKIGRAGAVQRTAYETLITAGRELVETSHEAKAG